MLQRKNLELIIISILIFIISYLSFGANLFKKEIIAPMDLLLNYNGFNESGLSLPLFNGERSDILDGVFSTWIFLRNSIINGKIPLWNPLKSGGVPAFQSLPSAFFSLGFLAFTIFGDGSGFSLTLILRLFIAGLGTYLLCRTKLGIAPSIFGAITYMMCGFNVTWLMWQQVETSMWIPWVLWALIRLEKKPNFHRTILFSLTIMALIFGGFPAVTGYGLYLALIFGVWLLILRISQEKKLCLIKKSLYGFIGVLIGFSLTSVQLIPFIELVNIVDISWRRASSLPLENIIFLFDPFRFDQPQVGRCGYVGLLPFFFAFIALSAAIWKKKWRGGQFSPILWTGIICFTLVAIYRTPEFIAKIIYYLPVFSNNPNNRLLVIFGLGMAILGAVGFQIVLEKIRTVYFSNRFVKQILVVFLILIIIMVQIGDVSRVGRAQNAVVPEETFFPETPSINYVREHILPGQSVIATGEAFHNSGVLTAYGLPEWFAHSYHNQEEKRILNSTVNDPWATPTAARFNFDQINLESDLIDSLGIRYILTSSLIHTSQKSNDRPSPPLPENVVGQTIQLNDEVHVIGLELLMATYRKKINETNLILFFYDDNGNQLTKCEVTGDMIVDNKWTGFVFDQELKLKPGEYYFELVVKNPPAPSISVWTLVGKDKYPEGNMIVNGQNKTGDLAFRLIGIPSKVLLKWNIVTPGENVIILERKNTPPGAFFLKEDAPFDEADASDFYWNNVKPIEYHNERQTFIVNTNSSGWLVKTARYWSGWNVYVNGTLSESRPYLGMLPAAHLDAGYSIVQWRYEALTLRVGAFISILTIVILIVVQMHQSLMRSKKDS